MTSKLVAPMAHELELHDTGGANAARLLAIVAVVLVCFPAGLLARTAVAQQLVGWLERAILSNLPGYTMMTDDRFRAIDMPIPAAMKCIKGMGLGSRALAGHL